MLRPRAIGCTLVLILFFAGIINARDVPPYIEFDPERPPQGVFIDDWMEIFLNGKKIGYANNRFQREGDKVFALSFSQMRVNRNGTPLKIEMLQTSEETVEGHPIRIHNRTRTGDVPVETEGIIEDNTIKLLLKQGEHTMKLAYPFPPNAKLTWGMTLENLYRDYEAGTQYSIPFYSPDIAAHSALEANIHIVGKETIDYFGTPLELMRMDLSMRGENIQVAMSSWVDENKRVIKTRLSNSGFPIDMILTTQEHALEHFENTEAFNPTFVELKEGIRTGAQRVKYQLSIRDGSALDRPLPETAYQKVEKKPDGSVLITVHKTDHKTLKETLPRLYTPPELEPYLESNLIFNLEDNALKQLLHESRALDHQRISRRAAKLTDFVYDFITEKNLDTGFATSSEICRKPEGDCTEHAVLLAALGRLADIPSRVVSGLLYIPQYNDRQNLMGYHMWTQFYIDGTWVDFDATLNTQACPPTRIALATSSLKDGSSGEISFAFWDLIGMLDISIISAR